MAEELQEVEEEVKCQGQNPEMKGHTQGQGPDHIQGLFDVKVLLDHLFEYFA